MHCLYAHSDTTMDPIWVCANAPIRLCICPGSSELSMLAYINGQVCLISWHVFQIVFFLRLRAQRRSDSVPEEEPDFSSISKYIFRVGSRHCPFGRAPIWRGSRGPHGHNSVAVATITQPTKKCYGDTQLVL